MKGAAALGLAAALPRWAKLSAADAPAVKTDSKTADSTKYNVLFIMSDDMRPELDLYGNPLVLAPNLTALAKTGVMFDRGYCPFPLCCPSRSATLNGRHVITTGVYSNRTWFGDLHPEYISLPKYFKQNGYITMHSGKIFHGGIDDTEAWTEGGQARVLGGIETVEMDIPLPPAGHAGVFGQTAAAQGGAAFTSATTRSGTDSIQILRGNGESHGDYHATDRAIQYLRDYKGKYGDQPFFLGYGLVKPHSPPTAPQKWFDQIDRSKIPLPVDFAPSRKLPAGFPEGCLRPRNADLFINRPASPEEAREMIQAYYASTSWTDWNIGRVLAELDNLGLREKTIICFSADHGYQLGEKGKWSKAGSLWEEGARIPMILSAPKAKGNGQVCRRIVQSMNFYPTLVELCGLPMPAGQEGQSMTKLLDDPKMEWNHPAYTVWSEDGASNTPIPNPTLTGIGVRVERWRYAEYMLGGAMLLDMENDPHQMKNLAHDARYAEVADKMAGLVKQYRDGKAAQAVAPVLSTQFHPGAPALPETTTAAPAKTTA